MPVTRVIYSITKQVRQYEPVRIEVEYTRDEVRQERQEDMLHAARQLAEDAMREAMERARAGTI